MMDENLHLLANPNHCYRKRIPQESIDEKITLLLKKKLPGIEITPHDYSINILKIENLFIETYQKRVVSTIIEEIIQKTENEQILF